MENIYNNNRNTKDNFVLNLSDFLRFTIHSMLSDKSGKRLWRYTPRHIAPISDNPYLTYLLPLPALTTFLSNVHKDSYVRARIRLQYTNHCWELFPLAHYSVVFTMSHIHIHHNTIHTYYIASTATIFIEFHRSTFRSDGIRKLFAISVTVGGKQRTWDLASAKKEKKKKRNGYSSW